MSRLHSAAALCATLALTACQDRPDGSGPVTSPGARTSQNRTAPNATQPQLPGRPVEVADAEVRAELDAAPRAAHPGGHEAAASIATFGRARTARALNELALGALAALHGDRGPEASAMRREIARAYNQAAPGVLPTVRPYARGVGACPVNFDDVGVLSTLAEPDDPQALFSSAPHWVQPCGSGNVHVEPLRYSHMHMSFEDPTIDCLDLSTGLFGRGTPAACTGIPAGQALQEPRFVSSHDGREVLRIQRRVGGEPATFTLHSFVVVGNTPVKLRYRTGNGPWFQWNSLAGNTAWDVSAYVTGVTEVQLTHAGTSLSCGLDYFTASPASCPVGAGPISVDDFSVSPGLTLAASARP